MGTQRFTTLDTEAAPQAFLILSSTTHSQTQEIGDFLTIGRDPENHLVVDDEFVSARHARVERRTQGFFVRDLRSSNGTHVNGTRVGEAWLGDGDRLKLGHTELIFSYRKDLGVGGFKLTSKNPAWNQQLQNLPVLADADFPMLILGPSGSGKEVVARMVHQFSRRRHRPFISVNCSALTENLVESELFGHVRGSFTGATHDRKGAFEAARSGTLFLDEIGDLPLPLQPKLLRALENREIKPVGSDHSIATDVRVLAATHQDLLRKVRSGHFREDLYYRLNVLQVRTLPLSQRLEDFEDLLYGFGREFRVGFTLAAIERLKAHLWPGNIRELRNTVARAAALYRGHRVEGHHVDNLLETKTASIETPAEVKGLQWLKSFERDMIYERLVANRGNQRKTAHELGIPKSTLHDRIRAYNIDLTEIVGRK